MIPERRPVAVDEYLDIPEFLELLAQCDEAYERNDREFARLSIKLARKYPDFDAYWPFGHVLSLANGNENIKRLLAENGYDWQSEELAFEYSGEYPEELMSEGPRALKERLERGESNLRAASDLGQTQEALTPESFGDLMQGLLGRKKRRISRDEFIRLILELQRRMRALLTASAKPFADQQTNRSAVDSECEALALWLLTLIFRDRKLNDDIHDAYVSSKGLTREERTDLFRYLDERYRVYFKAFNVWQQTPTSGHMLGTAALCALKGENPSTGSLSDPLEELQAFNLVTTQVEIVLKCFGALKHEYDLSSVDPSLA